MAHYRILTEATNYKQIPRDICFLYRLIRICYVYYSVVFHVGVQKTMTYIAKDHHQDKYVSYNKEQKKLGKTRRRS